MKQISNNLQKESARGFIQIQLQKTSFISNEQIEGVLNIHLEESFQGHLLEVNLVGIEKTSFDYTILVGSGDDSQEQTIRAFGLNKFINFSLPVYDFSQGRANDQFKMNPVSWQIPFSIGIASALPSSMKFYKDVIDCKLKYELVANITSTAKNYKPLSASQEIVISQYIQQSLGINSLDIIVTPFEFCCGSGYMKIAATVNKKAFTQNETIQVTLHCDLSTYSRKIDTMIVSLIGKLALKGDNPDDRTTVEIFNQPLSLKITQKAVLDTVSIVIPPNIQLSVVGDFITVNYFVQILAEIDSYCILKDNDPLNIPIIINPDQKQIQQTNIPPLNQANLPPKWNPQLLEQSQFTQQQSLSYQQKQGNLSKYQQQIQTQEISFFLEKPQMIKSYENKHL